MPIKWMNAQGVGSVGAYLDGLSYAIAHGATIINNSWTGLGNVSILSGAIQAAQAKGVIFVAAAGNFSTNTDAAPIYPADFSLDNIISVTATDQKDNLASFSDYGVQTVDLAAPGVNIYSTWMGGGYAFDSGTSMATPYVTGVLALVRGLHPTWSYQQVINQVLNTVDPIPGLTGKVESGGRLDAAAAVGWTVAYSIPFQAPVITNASSVASTLSTLKVTFNKAINPATFTPSTISVTGPTGTAIAVTAITPVAGSNNTQFLVTLPTQTSYGNYTVKVSTSVQDSVGFHLPANQTTITLVNPGPQVISFNPLLTGPGSTSAIIITFDRSVNPNTFVPWNTSLIGPAGNTITPWGVRIAVGSNNTQFIVLFNPVSTPGIYTFKLTGVRDTTGTLMSPYQAKFSLSSNGIGAVSGLEAPATRPAPQTGTDSLGTVTTGGNLGADNTGAVRWQLVTNTASVNGQGAPVAVGLGNLDNDQGLSALDSLFLTPVVIRQLGRNALMDLTSVRDEDGDDFEMGFNDFAGKAPGLGEEA
jgi:hypothetical protein